MSATPPHRGFWQSMRALFGGKRTGPERTYAKVVGVGLNKTGTTTLGVCLKQWGFDHVSTNWHDFQSWRLGKMRALMRTVRKHDSFEDWPWPLVYREIDEAFPGSKFILTRRSTPEVWYESLCKHAARRGPNEVRKVIYGHAMPHDHRDEHLAFYTDHLAAVREYFADRPADLLEVCWEEGDGWNELAAFLDLPAPDADLPHANRAPEA